MRYRSSLLGELVVPRIRNVLYQEWLDEGTDDAVARGKAITKIAGEAQQVGRFAGEAIAAPLVQMGTLISIIAYMAVSQPLLGLLIFLIILPQAAIVLALQKYINRRVAQRVKILRRRYRRYFRRQNQRSRAIDPWRLRRNLYQASGSLPAQAVDEVRPQRHCRCRHGGDPVAWRMAVSGRQDRYRYGRGFTDCFQKGQRPLARNDRVLPDAQHRADPLRIVADTPDVVRLQGHRESMLRMGGRGFLVRDREPLGWNAFVLAPMRRGDECPLSREAV